MQNSVYCLHWPYLKPSQSKVLILVAGGAFIVGHKGFVTMLCRALRLAGILCIAVDYRYWPQTSIDGMIDDVDSAIQWSFDNAAKYGGDPKSVAYLVCILRSCKLDVPSRLIFFSAFCSDCFAFLLDLADDCSPFLSWAPCIESWPSSDCDRRPLEFKSTLSWSSKWAEVPLVIPSKSIKDCNSQMSKGYVGTSPNPAISKSDCRAR